MTKRCLLALAALLVSLCLAVPVMPAVSAMPAPVPALDTALDTRAVLTIPQVKQVTGFTGPLTLVGGTVIRRTEKFTLNGTQIKGTGWEAVFVSTPDATVYPTVSAITRWQAAADAGRYYRRRFDKPNQGGLTGSVVMGERLGTAMVLLYDGSTGRPRTAMGIARSGSFLAIGWCALSAASLDSDGNPKPLTPAAQSALVDCASKLSLGQRKWATTGTLG